MTLKDAAAQTILEGVRLSNPERVLFPEQGLTKRDLAAYLASVSPWMLPHVARRPITLVRCPAGRAKKCFYQRHAGPGATDGLRQAEIPGFEEAGAYLYLTQSQELVGLAQMGVLEIHPWGARIDRPDRPDLIVFDLDPGEGTGFDAVIAAALDVREALAKLNLVSFCKTTGGKGLHVVTPIERRTRWPEAKAFARALAEAMARAEPHRFLTRMAKAERHGRILIDYLRNDPTSTAIAPYSPRAREGAPVATPLAWAEVRAGLDPQAFTVRTVPGRLASLRRDPWRDMERVRQRLPTRL